MNNKKIVLIIEDDRAARQVVVDTFKEAGFEALEAVDGVEGFKLACEKRPNIIILDLILPNISGVEVIKLLKKNKDTKDIPIIILSGSTDSSVVSNIVDTGVFDYFSKTSVDLEKLVQKVKKKLKTD